MDASGIAELIESWIGWISAGGGRKRLKLEPKIEPFENVSTYLFGWKNKQKAVAAF